MIKFSTHTPSEYILNVVLKKIAFLPINLIGLLRIITLLANSPSKINISPSFTFELKAPFSLKDSLKFDGVTTYVFPLYLKIGFDASKTPSGVEIPPYPFGT